MTTIMEGVKHSLASTLLICLSVTVWVFGFEITDWAIVGLAPLAVTIFLGSRELAWRPWKVTLRVAVRDTSWLSRYLTGQLRAFAIATGFTALAIWLVAWQTLSASVLKTFLMLTCVFVASGVFFIFEGFARHHFHQPFARNFSVFFSTLFVASVYFIVFAYYNWACREIPGELNSGSFADAVKFGFEQAPLARGWLGDLVALNYSFDAALIWSSINLTQSIVPKILYLVFECLTSAPMGPNSGIC
ncbi:hypothetical protein CSC82_21285 [Rhodobacteraceae bacterium 4F10]|nr:hypothetical protein CSC82_21285 [Rhodobacteraceae bacterium 4F10]